MRWLQKVRMRLQTFFHRQREVQHLDAELAFHLEQQIAENIAAGMNPQEARYAAMRAFGNPALLKEETRETWRWVWLEQLARNLRYATRTLARTPAFAIAAIMVIALGIGATTALFTVVRSVLLNPLPFEDPARLIRLYEQSSDGKFPYNVVAGGVFAEWKKQSRESRPTAVRLCCRLPDNARAHHRQSQSASNRH